jgi:hypothetical protein
MTEAKMTKSKTGANDVPEGPAEPMAAAQPKGKLGTLVDLLRRPEGATLKVMQEATGWQAHSVRGAIAGSIKKKLGFSVSSAKADGERIYRIDAGAGA